METNPDDKFGMEKRSGHHLNHQISGVSADCRFGKPSMGAVPANPPIAMGQGVSMTSSSCPSVPGVDFFGPGVWSHPTNPQNLGFSNAQITRGGASSSIPIGKPVAVSSRGMFLQAVPGVLPPSLSHFPADSAFIERAARFSCFNGGNFGGMMNHFGPSESLTAHSNASRGVAGTQGLKSELNMAEVPRNITVPTEHGSSSGSPSKNQRDKGSSLVGGSSNVAREANFTEVDQEKSPELANAAGNSSSSDLCSKKRKRSNQDVELDQLTQLSMENTKDNTENKQNLEENNSKPNGKQAKESTEGSKEDYIHVRARRGQATNSHSLAERVRREKISERMKYLQDLVPGCSKVTGKAVMLDEIINYVQSLQRQVEFLSMKLATVNPRADFNVEGLLSKDLFQFRGGSSSMMGFSPDMIHPQLHPSQQGLVQAGISGMGSPSDAVRRAMNAQLTAMNGFKEPTPQIPNVWDDELHNVMQLSYSTNPPLNTKELNGKPRDGFLI